MPTTANAGLRYLESVIAGLFQNCGVGDAALVVREGQAGLRNERAPRKGAGRTVTAKSGLSHDRFTGSHFEAVALFVMLTTCTRRFASDMGWLGSLSLVLPYPTVTRSVPAIPNLSTRKCLIASARRSDKS